MYYSHKVHITLLGFPIEVTHGTVFLPIKFSKYALALICVANHQQTMFFIQEEYTRQVSNMVLVLESDCL
jgi:hypothetical protein